MGKEKKPKKAKEPFWKKYGAELDSLTKHIGKTADNMKFNDWADLAIMGGLAYLGYDITKDWRGLLIGPIGYKLATTMGGTPPVSQIAGLATLASMGVASIIPPLIEQVKQQIIPKEVIENMARPGYWPKEWWGYIPFAEDIARLLEQKPIAMP